MPYLNLLSLPPAKLIQIVWLTWGISNKGLETLPPTIWRLFGFERADDGVFKIEDHSTEAAEGGLGHVKLANGSVVDAGRMLMRDQWNTALHGPLGGAFQAGLAENVPDVRFHKERLSGLWGPSTDCEAFLRGKGITTLLFASVNTDQCVLTTIQDAFAKGFDTVLLKDGCGTTSLKYARKMVDFNCQKLWGFVSSCVVKNILREQMAEKQDSDRSEL